MVLMHDVGMLARVRDDVLGFKIVVGDGLSTNAMMAKTLREFVPADDLIKNCEPVLRVFNRQDEERKIIGRTRINFTITRLGMDKFREMLDEELEGDWAKKEIDLDSLMFVDDEDGDAPAVDSGSTP